VPRHSSGHPPKIKIEHLSFWYGRKQVLYDVSLTIFDNEVTVFIGPSGCGKSTLLQCMNRTAEITPGTHVEGIVSMGGTDLYAPDVDLPEVRRRFAWVAQQPNPFPRSIIANVLYGPRIHGLIGSSTEEQIAEKVLRRAGLWEEVKDRLNTDAYELSLGQQQRLCIARAISIDPEVILMDEPCASLDPIATATVEQLISTLRTDHAVVVITHSIPQAARLAQRIAFFHMGRLVECGDAEQILLRPRTQLCANFVTGRFG
jgi:phosphate transport system ATP-binding protein